MSVFDPAIFDPAVFDSSVAVASGSIGLAFQVNIVSPLVFSGGSGDVSWYATLLIDGADFSDRLAGKISIQGGEDSARTATVELLDIAEDQLEAFDGARITLDVTLFNGPYSGTWRRFTGVVDSVGEYSVFDKSVSLSCSDGWQERSKACASAAEVHALLAGRASPCNAIVPWSDTQPDPAGYFDALLATLPGATYIDSWGTWQVVSWSITAPAARFSAADIFDDSPTLTGPSRADLPASISAALTLRYPRLHAVEVPIGWAGLSYYRLFLDGCSWPTRATVQSCIDGLSSWYLKGKVSFTMLENGAYPVVHDGGQTYFPVSWEMATTVCNGMAATMYRRWYQQVDLTYSIDIAMGGKSERDSAISVSVSSDFDASSWESASSSETGAEIYAANAPASTVVTTGYAGLPGPWPPVNGALDYYPDLDGDLLLAAVNHVVARATRTAAAGRRRRLVKFSKPFDPRWEIGTILEVVVGRFRALGQLVDFSDELDHDSGDISTTLTIAVPAGNSTVTGFSASIDLPGNQVVHAYSAPALGNHIGASTETAADPVEDDLLGMLTNVLGWSDSYDPDKPVFVPQFRITMPEILASDRDPVSETKVISAEVNIASGTLDLDFGG